MSDIFETIVRLRAEGAPFCVVTVVRTADATSAKAGAKAVVDAEGRLVGHLGGACVRRAVLASAAACLETEAVRLIRVAPGGTVEADDVTAFRSGCPSGGTIDLLVEPHRPAPRLVVLGRTPVAAAIARQGGLLGLRVLAETDRLDAPVAGAEPVAADLGRLAFEARDAVAIACQGEGDLDAAAAALGSGAGFVSMVASARKAATIRRRLEGRGLDPARIAALRAPAGVPIGAVDPAEIALSVVAELAAWRRARECAEAPAGALPLRAG